VGITVTYNYNVKAVNLRVGNLEGPPLINGPADGLSHWWSLRAGVSVRSALREFNNFRVNCCGLEIIIR
jgi:hypothetical protein